MRLYSAKALDRNGEGDRDTLIAGIRWGFLARAPG